MKMNLGCFLLLIGAALLARQLLPERQTALAGAFAAVVPQPVPDRRPFVAAQAPSAIAAHVAANVPLPRATRVTLGNSPPEGSERNAQGADSIEAMRETERQQILIEQLKRLLAQRAVLAAEREAAAAAVPTQLIDLAGEREAERLVAAQARARVAGIAEIEVQDTALAASARGLGRELLALHQWLAQIAVNSSIKSDRLRLLQTAKKGSIAGVTLGEARTAVAEIEERRQEVLVAIAQTEQKLTQAQQDRAKLVRHARSELEQGLLSTEAQISQGVVSLNTSQRVLAALQQQTAAQLAASAPFAEASARGADL